MKKEQERKWNVVVFTQFEPLEGEKWEKRWTVSIEVNCRKIE